MAVVVVKSTGMTNRDATPRVINNPAAFKQLVQGFLGQAVVTSGNSTGSTYLFGQIPSNAVVRSVRVSAPDIGTTTTMDIGLYRSTADGSAVVDADFFAAAVVLNAGAIANTDVTRLNVATIALCEKMVWELLGLSADPKVIYDVVGTLVGAADGTGTMMVDAAFAV